MSSDRPEDVDDHDEDGHSQDDHSQDEHEDAQGDTRREAPIRERPPLPDPVAVALLERGEIDVLGRMPWSSNGTFLCDIDTEGVELPDDPADADAPSEPVPPLIQAVYKPHAGEQPLWDFPSGLYTREVACYELSSALGWALVPPTVLREGPLGVGSLQLFVPCDFDEHYFTLQDELQYRGAFERLTAFDFMANSTDRKAGHVLLGHDGAIHAIDNGLSFHAEYKLRTVLWDFAGDPVPQDVIDDMAAFLAADIPESLNELLTTFEVDALRSRTRALIADGHFPTDPTGRRWPWPLV